MENDTGFLIAVKEILLPYDLTHTRSSAIKGGDISKRSSSSSTGTERDKEN